MERFFIKFSVWIIILAASIQIHGCKGCLEKERVGLLEIKNFFISISDRDVENILPSWVDDGVSECCFWEGVRCNATTDQVMQLSLNNTRQWTSDNGFDGFPILDFSLFFPFQELQSLDLSDNRFEGWEEKKAHDDDSFGSLKQLKMINLNNNYFNDSVFQYLSKLSSLTTLNLHRNNVEELPNLINLEALDLGGNNIKGSLAEQGLSNFKNLKALDLSINSLNGSLESQGICELENLVELDLGDNYFEGCLPQCLNNLTGLKVLVISGNQFNGNLPSVIANLTSLQYLDLSSNNFEGIFSLGSLANLSKLDAFILSAENNKLQVKIENWLPTLKVLHLSDCKLNGTIPSFLLYQYDLNSLDLSHNKLVGDFPTWLLQNNTKLEALLLANNSFAGILQLPNFKHDLIDLDISRNGFIGKLPRNMGSILPKLKYINISRNNFEGHIPSSIGEMKELQLMDLSRNNLSGELPLPLLTGCFSLFFLDLSTNNFYGQIFPNSLNLFMLLWLYLDNNHFSGTLKDGLLNSSQLVVLDISNNELSGPIPLWIGNFSHLEILLMSKNLLEGNVPMQLNNLEILLILDVSENCLSGTISSSFNISSVGHLYMRKNALGGLIPNVLFKSNKLMTLDLGENNFFGEFPDEINEHSNLRFLLLGGNQLQGHIPNQLCQLQKLGILDLSRNRLNGSIPLCFVDVLSWKLGNDDLYGYLNVYSIAYIQFYNRFYSSFLHLSLDGDIHVINGRPTKVEFVTKNRDEVYNGINLNYMTGLDLSCNELIGDIPLEIGQLEKIRGLNLSHNFLSGFIPISFFNLKMIESLDLSSNRLKGRIPPRLIELNYLSNFNVSYNYLSGPIPNERQFATFGDNSYLGNPNLCGETINRSCVIVEETPIPTSCGGEEDEFAIDIVSFYWSFGASTITFILGLFAILWVNSYWRRLWFCFVEACIDLCYFCLVKCVYFVRDHATKS